MRANSTRSLWLKQDLKRIAFTDFFDTVSIQDENFLQRPFFVCNTGIKTGSNLQRELGFGFNHKSDSAFCFLLCKYEIEKNDI